MKDESVKALLIEDDKYDALIIREMLSRAKGDRFDLEWVNRLSTGLERLAEGGIDAVLLDLGLPDSQGLETLSRANAQAPEVPVVVLTGFADEMLAVEAVRAGAQDYLVKGQVDGNLLVRSIRYAIERHRMLAELEQQAQELQASETRLRTIIEKAADSTIIVDGNGMVRFVNPAAESLFRRKAEEFLGESLGLPVVAGETTEIDIIRRGGETATAEMRVVETMWEGESVHLASLHDITERKRAEEALRETRDYLDSLIRSTNAPVIVWDPQARITRFNHAFEHLTGYTADEVVGQQLHMLFPETSRDELLHEIADTLSSEYWESVEIPILRKDGNVRLVLWSSANIHTEDGATLLATIAQGQDITRRKQHEREVEAIATVSTALRTAPTRAEMLPVILDQLMDLLNADGVALATRDPATDETVIELARREWTYWSGERLLPGEGISGQVIATGQPYVDNDVQVDPLFGRPDMRFSLHAVACVPLSVQEQVIGALWLGRNRAIAEEEARLVTTIADIAASAIHRATLHEQTQQRLQRLTALREIDKAITASLDLRVTFDVVLDRVTAQLGVDAADILLFNPHAQTLEYAAGRGFRSRALRHTNLRLGEGHAGLAALERRLVSIPNLEEAKNALRRAPLLPQEEFIAYYGVPLIAKGEVKGVLEIFHRAPLDTDPEWVDFLETLAGQVAIAIDNATLFDNLQRSNVELTLAYDTTLEGWARALELRDHETEGHSQRVTELTLRLARAMGISDTELVHVRRGALLHDIGKIGIPDTILLKPGPLTEDEWCIMRQHPVYAYKMLLPIAYLRPALDIPYYHHEKWDGTGYPRGLKGEEIPLAARIFAVVDVWDALRSDRPYRPVWPKEKAIQHIREQAGKHFDPQVVEMFLRLPEIADGK